MRVEINFRPYPAKRPPRDAWSVLVMTRLNGVMTRECHAGTISENPVSVTHFALPEDITITEEKREG